MKIRSVGVELGHAERRKDEANSRFYENLQTRVEMESRFSQNTGFTCRAQRQDQWEALQHSVSFSVSHVTVCSKTFFVTSNCTTNFHPCPAVHVQDILYTNSFHIVFSPSIRLGCGC